MFNLLKFESNHNLSRVSIIKKIILIFKLMLSTALALLVLQLIRANGEAALVDGQQNLDLPANPKNVSITSFEKTPFLNPDRSRDFSDAKKQFDIAIPSFEPSSNFVIPPVLPTDVVTFTSVIYLPAIFKEGAPPPAPPTLPAPVLLAPSDNNLEGQPVFDWMDVISATSYHFELSSTSGFSSLVISQTVASSSFTLTTHLNGRYYWRVAASDGSIDSPYSTVWTVRLLSLTAPTLLEPAPDSLQVKPTFDWTDVISATAYQFQLSATDSFTSPVISQTVSSSSFVLTTTLNSQYYWRVAAINGSIRGPYSEIRPVQLSVLDVPILLTPEADQAQAQPTFDWTDVVNATAYQVQLSASSVFTNMVISQTVNSSNFGFTPIQEGIYYWRVRGVIGAIPGPFSEVRAVQLVSYLGDEDGDSLPNGWELHGYDATGDGVIDVNLPLLGADYRHKDVFVEMDYMVRASATHGLAPSQTVMDRIIAVFATAPVSNPDGVDGIKLHLELDDVVPYDDNWPWDSGQVFEFYDLKSTYFDSVNAPIYHYMIWGNKYGSNTAEDPGTMGYSRRAPGEDFFITLGPFNSQAGGTDDQKVNAFVHELGHNLGLIHGGQQNANYKPNYFSVMNYRWALTGVVRNSGDPYSGYQAFNLPSLNENSLDETVGLGGGTFLQDFTTVYYCPNGSLYSVPADGPIDWNCDGDAVDQGVKVDLNKDGSFNTLRSDSDWDKIVLDGGNRIGP